MAVTRSPAPAAVPCSATFARHRWKITGTSWAREHQTQTTNARSGNYLIVQVQLGSILGLTPARQNWGGGEAWYLKFKVRGRDWKVRMKVRSCEVKLVEQKIYFRGGVQLTYPNQTWPPHICNKSRLHFNISIKHKSDNPLIFSMSQ